MYEEIKEKTKGYALNNGKEFAIPLDSLSKFIEMCEESDIAISGFDGAKIDGNSFELLQDWIADFSSLSLKCDSWEEYQKASIESSKKFVEQINVEDVYFVPSLTTKLSWQSRNEK